MATTRRVRGVGMTAGAASAAGGLAVLNEHLPTISSISIEVREQTPAERVISSLHTALDRWQAEEASHAQLRYSIGKILLEIQRRELYSPAHPSFEAFLQAEVVGKHMAVATAKVAMRVSRVLAITPEQYETLGAMKSLEATKAVEAGLLQATALPAMIPAATALSTAAFREQLGLGLRHVAGTMTAPAGMVTLSIQVPPEVADAFEELAEKHGGATAALGWLMLKALTTSAAASTAPRSVARAA